VNRNEDMKLRRLYARDLAIGRRSAGWPRFRHLSGARATELQRVAARSDGTNR